MKALLRFGAEIYQGGNLRVRMDLRYLWRWMNWLERLVVIVLALMLVHIILIVIRVSYRYHLARRTKVETASEVFQRGRRTLVADLNLTIGSLKSIASTAPFLGLGGTCLGILSIFRGYDGSRYGYVVMVATGIAAALISTAAGLIVAIPAVSFHNYLRIQTDFLEREISSAVEQASRHFQFAQRLPLTPRFSTLPFAVIAVPTLAIVVAVFMTFSSFHRSMGLNVRLLNVGVLETENDFLAEPIVIGIVEASTNGQIAVYVNSKKVPLKQLDAIVANELKSRPQSIAYVAAENTVRWADVATVIDTIECLPARVALLTTSPPNPTYIRRSGKSMRE